MTERYLGSIISPSPVEPSDNLSNATASGVWNIHDPLIFGQAGDWPDPTNVPSVGLFMAGYAASAPTNTVQTIVPESAGDATDFGDLSASNYTLGALSSDTRSVAGGGYYNNSARTNIIEYFTFASAGNATDFGDLSATAYNTVGISNNVRGIFALGTTGTNVNTLEYITIASTGNTTDFGDATEQRHNAFSVGSSTRAIFAGNGGYSNVIEYVTIVSTANAIDFGDLTAGRGLSNGGASSSTRGVFGPAYTNAYSNVLDYITIASTGNATDFGDAVDSTYGTSGMSNATKGIFCGGQNSGGRVNVIQQITIATTGDATDFGDLLSINSYNASTCSANPAVQNESYFAPASIGLYAGGVEPVNSANQSLVAYLNIATDGQAAMFGDLSAPRQSMFSGGMASSTRAVFGGGGIAPSPYYVDIIDFFTFSTKGKATDFGDTTVARQNGASLSNSTRGLMVGGSAASKSDVVDYITIASAGNATDFGDANAAYGQQGATAGTTRGLVAGGNYPPVDNIDYYTIASTGNATDFGDLTVGRRITPAGVSSNTRAVFGGGASGSGSVHTNILDYVTIASTGDATDFGDLTSTSIYSVGLSNKTQGLITKHDGGNGTLDVDKITIASTGNATDWGENIAKNYGVGSASNSHGGLS